MTPADYPAIDWQQLPPVPWGDERWSDQACALVLHVGPHWHCYLLSPQASNQTLARWRVDQ